MKKLYVVATPIGNINDITIRAIQILKDVEIVACEDTRKTGLLLNRLGIPKKQLLSYYEENEQRRIPEILELLKQGKSIALVSNSGTPTISDPGYKLVRECLNQGIKVEAIPGPSAILTALVSSGLPTDKFLFLGFLPQKQGKRLKLLKNCKLLPVSCTLIFYESPYRLIKTLNDMFVISGDLEIVICRELTKIYEEIKRGKINELITYFEKNQPKGEFTVLFHP